jgi:pantoate--beta-alanine ligase
VITARSIDEARAALATARMHGAKIGFVPTMGFLHEGHLSLIDEARALGATFIAVSIFVNPLQFGPAEDFEKYPRDEVRDAELLEARGVDLLFLPSVAEMYPAGASTVVKAGAVAEPLEGERRPGHFDGVATIVLKLFNVVQPDIAAFGRKDAQQCAVIAAMVRDLDLPVQLLFGETIRDENGLAKSSRNTYLSPEDRKRAPALHRALRAGEEALRHGVDDVAAIELLMRKMAAETDGVEVDYLALVDPETFRAPLDMHRELLLAGAVRIGKTRLIDNIVVPRRALP